MRQTVFNVLLLLVMSVLAVLLWLHGAESYPARAAKTQSSVLRPPYSFGSPQSSLTDTVRLAVIGDFGYAGQPEADVAALVHGWDPELVLTVGDNNYEVGSAKTIDANIGQYYHDFIYPYFGKYGKGADQNRFFPILGNHDWDTPGAQPYLDYFTLPNNERYYDFTWGPVHFFGLDSDVREPDGITSGSVQGIWLQGRLAASTSPWKLVYVHHPPYSSGVGGSHAALQWPYEQWGADAVMSGHDHTYERIIRSGFPYFVNGLGGRNLHTFGTPVPGSQVRYNADFGAMLVDADTDDMTFRFYSRAGALVDTYVMVGPSPTSTPLPTNTPTRTSTATRTVTPTPVCCQGGVTGSITSWCQGNEHWYSWVITNSCALTVNGYGSFVFQTAPDPGGPWRNCLIGDYFSITFAPGRTEETGYTWSQPLPSGDSWWRTGISFFDSAHCWQVVELSSPQPACVLGGSPTPTTVATAIRTSTPMATATTCPTGAGYVITTSFANIITATTDIGNYCNDCTTTIGLPFPIQLMDGTFTVVTVGSNGVLHFVGGTNSPQNVCLPAAGVSYTIMPHWDDLRTDGVNGGIFTSVLGSAPDRMFVIEWRARYAQSGNPVSFEVILLEGYNRFDVIYGLVPEEGMSTTVGVQRDPGRYTEYWCNRIPLRSNYRVSFNYQPCLTPTVVATNSPTGTSQPPTSTSISSPTETATISASSTPTATSTPEPTPQCGLAWRPVPNPLGGTLYGVEAIASDDVWAVGENGAMHWDGNGWRVVPGPLSGLRDVVALSSNDVWVVGVSGMQHWDGNSWLSYAIPVQGSLYGVDALGPSDVWAVGYAIGGGFPLSHTLVLHWDGSAWSRIPSPNPFTRVNTLRDIVAISANDIWAVGDGGGNGPFAGPIAIRWDGSQWSSAAPEPNTSLCVLYGVTATSSNMVWAVGRCPDQGPSVSAVYLFDGSTWSRIPVPNVGTLNGVSALSAIDTWAVGARGILRWDGLVWRQENAPLMSLQAVDALSLEDVWAVGEGILHYSSALFADVPPDHTFYSFIQCLACRGIISGYADGTFRPGENVTRGQLSKIVANAAGYDNDPGPQIYEDVPTGHTFYVWINRLTLDGVMSGYPCGGPGEPCGPENRPYFRPHLNATRGQVAQIVDRAAGFLEPPPNMSIYEDVPPSNPFWVGIQRLSARGIMSGYPCGGPGEPCVPPGNRPYFRWANTATRGQVSKIVANTFFLACEVGP